MKEIKVVVIDENIDLYLEGDNIFSVSTLSANCMGDYWYISRVLVNPKEERGKGIGSRLLKRLIEEIKKKNGKRIVVTPGGYDNDQQRQFNFYLNNGFIKKSDCFEFKFEGKYEDRE